MDTHVYPSSELVDALVGRIAEIGLEAKKLSDERYKITKKLKAFDIKEEL